METRVADIRAGRRAKWSGCWNIRRLYTAGTSARTQDLLQPARFPVHVAGRCGQYTYHGPGQRVAYVMLDLRRAARTFAATFPTSRNGPSARSAASLQASSAERREGASASVVRPDKPPLPDGSPRRTRSPPSACASAIGWHSHGISINVEPDLSHYAGIVPCGIADHGVTSLVDLGLPVTLADLDAALAETFQEVFGELRPSPPRKARGQDVEVDRLDVDRVHSREGGPWPQASIIRPTASSGRPPAPRPNRRCGCGPSR